MLRNKKFFTIFLVGLFVLNTLSGITPGYKAQAQQIIPQIQFASAPVTEYTVGDRVQFRIFTPNYTGKVEYRVVLWNDSKKDYYDLWHAGNGYPTHYYTKWQPKGNDIFTLGWPIFEPGTYRITVYAKRVGIPASKAALKGMNCDSFMESVAFTVNPAGPSVKSILSINDVTVNQGSVPTLPKTVKAVMSDGTQKDLSVHWNSVDTSRTGTFLIEGNAEGAPKKVYLRLIVTPGILNIQSINAISSTSIYINLYQAIGFVPEPDRFSLKNANNSSISINSVIMSSDCKVIQLVVDFMVPGSWNILKIDGRNYNFNVPSVNGGNNNPYTVSITAYDKAVGIGRSEYANVVTVPSDAELSYTSNNPSVAAVNRYTGLITGISAGEAFITVSAAKQGYNTGWSTFKVVVGSTAQMVGSPTAIPAAGEVEAGTPIVLLCPTDGAEIYYTLDGTNPSTSSARYREPITIFTNTIIKAIAVKPGMNNSQTATFVYTVRSSTVSTNAWLTDKSYSSTNYYYCDWSGPFEITLNKTTGNRRVLVIHNLYAKNITTDVVKNYGDVTFTETGDNTFNFTTGTWDGVFAMGEYWSSYEHGIRFKNGSTVELKILNPLHEYPSYIGEWFK